MLSWYLSDAEEIAAANKYTFYKPSAEVIAQVKVGEVVKLIFEFESDDPEGPSAERMWVMVDSLAPDGSFTGHLDNHPQCIQDLKAGDPITFEARHIINTQHDDEENLVRRYIKRCFVTERVLYDGVQAGYIYREAPNNEQDSGWRITANDETDEYMDDPGNIFFVSLGAVLSKDDSFVHLLESPEGSRFTRDTATGEFTACTDA